MAHGYGVSEKHTQETDDQVNTVYALQALECAEMEDKGEMTNLTIINLILSQSLTQAQETIMVLSNQLHSLQTQANAKTPTIKRPVLDKNTKVDKLKC